MKSKLIMMWVCVGLLGVSFACSGEEKATTETDTAVPQAESRKRQTPPMKQPAKAQQRPAPKAEEPETAADDDSKFDNLTNGECFPDSIPDSAPQTAKLCISLVKSAPNSPFTKQDLEGMPEECKPYVLEKCR